MSIGSIDSQQSYVSQSEQTKKKPPSAEDMFNKLTQDVGGDGKTITKDQLESSIKKLESDSSTSSADKHKLGFLKQLNANFDKISNGSDSITSDDLKKGKDYLKPPEGGSKGSKGAKGADATAGTKSTSSSSSSKLTKDQLQSYLNELKAMNASDSDIAKQIQQAISNYGKSSSSSTLTEAAIQKAIKDLKSDNSSSTDPQDPSTVTSDQLESPIDIRV